MTSAGKAGGEGRQSQDNLAGVAQQESEFLRFQLLPLLLLVLLLLLFQLQTVCVCVELRRLLSGLDSIHTHTATGCWVTHIPQLQQQLLSSAVDSAGYVFCSLGFSLSSNCRNKSARRKLERKEAAQSAERKKNLIHQLYQVPPAVHQRPSSFVEP